MLSTEYIFIIALLVCTRCCGMYTSSVCYIWVNDSQSSLCDNNPSICCNSKELVSVDSIKVYHNNTGCNTVNRCGGDNGCCTTYTVGRMSETYKIKLNEAFKNTNCFNDITDTSFKDELPKTGGIFYGVVSYTCSENHTNIAAAVAVPITLIVVIALVIVIILYLRRRGANKEQQSNEVNNPTSYNGSLPKYAQEYMNDGALPSNDEIIDNEYAEIPGSHTNSPLETGDYNTIDPIQHQQMKKGNFQNEKQAENEDYDHIGMQPSTKAKEGETYSHIQHAAPQILNKGNGGDFGCTDTYAHIDHVSIQSHKVNRSHAGDGTYDITSSLNASRRQGDDVDGIYGYDRTKPTKDTSEKDEYGGYSQVDASR